jgi:protein-tyrosine-phosphatase
LDRLKAWAQKKFPIQMPVRVYLRPVRKSDYHGYAEYDPDTNRAVIVISPTNDKSALVSTFCEEWAHLRTIHLEDDDADDPAHGPTFWAEYGRIEHAARQLAW